MAWWLSAPRPLDELPPLTHPPDPAKGKTLFYAGDCGSCHGAQTDTGTEPTLLAGGRPLKTRFGIFYPPNISSDRQAGIGSWSLLDFVNAMKRGVSPQGHHYYPAFPYTSFSRMTVSDLADLKAYLDTLPPMQDPSRKQELNFPWRWRRGVGLWKRIFLNASPVVAVGEDPQSKRGRYLVEGPGHCGECHTPRNRMFGLRRDAWLAGAKIPVGDDETAPDITPGKEGIGDWSLDDIQWFLETGFDPDADTVKGAMVGVQENLAKLSESDRQAIAAYLKKVPAHASTAQGK